MVHDELVFTSASILTVILLGWIMLELRIIDVVAEKSCTICANGQLFFNLAVKNPRLRGVFNYNAHFYPY